MDISWVVELIRIGIWTACKFAFEMMDAVYDILRSLAGLNLGDFQFIWKWWEGICVFLTFFILIRVIIQYFKAMLDEDLLEKYDPLTTVKRIAVIAFIILFLPIMMDSFSEISSTLTVNIGNIVTGTDIESKPSQVLISVGYNNTGSSVDLNSIDIEEIDINEIDSSTDQYALLPKTFDILFVFVTSIIAGIIFVFVAIQIAQRIMGLLLKILISPFALSGIVDPGDNTFSIWTRLCIADFLTTFFQMVLVFLVVSISAAVPLSNAIAKTLFFIGALMAVMNAPSGIAQLLGGDVGVGTAFQQAQSLLMLGTGLQVAGSAIASGSAAGFYGAGRALGGESLINSGRALGDVVSGGSAGGGAGFSRNTQIPSFSGITNSPASGSGGYSAATESSGGGDSILNSNRMTTPGSKLGEIADFNAQDRTGRMFNDLASGLYFRSAQRLSRPVQYRNARGGMQTRSSRVYSASRAVHGAVSGARSVVDDLIHSAEYNNER